MRQAWHTEADCRALIAGGNSVAVALHGSPPRVRAGTGNCPRAPEEEYGPGAWKVVGEKGGMCAQ